MKEYKYEGFDEPIKVDDEGNITYRGREVEKFYYGYNARGCPIASYRSLMISHYITEMKRIDNMIKTEECRNCFKNRKTAEEEMKYFHSLFE